MDGGSRTCGRCGTGAPPGARFCGSCGGPLDETPLSDVRKTVTALFCDVTGSTELAGNLDPEALRSVMERYFATASEVIAGHGGTVEKFVGDAVMAVFGVPVAHEDDALRACRAGLGIVSAVAAVNEVVATAHGATFAVRVGIETGEVLVGDPARGSTFATGPAVNVAARLEQAAAAGECLIGPACRRMVRELVATEPVPGLALKGVPDKVDAARLVAVNDIEPESPSAPLVGRARELALLEQAFDRAAVDRTCQLATLLGVAGMGKTRVTTELLDQLAGRATVLRGRCLPYGEGVTYWPLVEAVRQAAGLDGSEPVDDARGRVGRLFSQPADAAEVVPKLGPAAGLGGAPASAEDTSWAIRRLLAELSRDRPLVLVVEDLHWAEPGLIAVLEDVCTWLRDAPVLVLLNARPEFLDDYPTWGAGQINSVTARLEPLTDDELGKLSVELLGGSLPEAVDARLRLLAGGNPLYVQQMIGMLVDEGDLRRTPSGWVADEATAHVEVPPTVSSLIAARLDRLPADERSALGVAAVSGQVFYPAAVQELSSGADVSAALSALLRKGLVEPVESDLAGQSALRFGHVLVRDAAYDALPKAVRADLHERFARWLQHNAAGQAVDDFIGSHLELAYLARAALGSPDAATRALGEEAADRLADAARLLIYVDDEAAAALLERADRLLVADDERRWRVRRELAAGWHRQIRRLPEAQTLAESVVRAAEAAGDVRSAMLARLVRARIRQDLAPEGATDELQVVAEEALRQFASSDDDEGLFFTHFAFANVAHMHTDLDGQLTALRTAAHHARRAGRNREAETLRRRDVVISMMGAASIEESLAAALEQWEAGESRASRLIGAGCAAACWELTGFREQAADGWAFAEREAAESGFSEWPVLSAMRSLACTALGNWVVAAELQETMCAFFQRSGVASRLSTEAAYLSIINLHLADVVAARRALDVAVQSSSADDVATQTLAAVAQAWLAAVDGDATLARQHMATADGMPPQMLLDRALMHRAFCRVEEQLGDPEAAAAHRRQAVALYRQKGATAAADLLEAG